MREIFLGDVIRQRRLDLGLTQEQLGEGICEQATICRFEKGTQTPTHNRIKALLQRLGLPGNRYFAFLSKNEEMIEILRNDIRKLEILFHLSNDTDRPELRARIWDKLSKLENAMDSDDPITRQYILYNRVSVGCPIKPYTPAEQITLLITAIQLTVPRFELDAIHGFHFSEDELNIIGLLADSYLNMGQIGTAISIYHQLFQYMKKNGLQSHSCMSLFCRISCHYAKTLSAKRRYGEAIEIAEVGWQACIEHEHYLFLPALLTTLASCHYLKGDKDQSTAFYYQAYYLLRSIKDDHFLPILKKEIKERLNLDIPY
ncbi:MAG: helix-turn-helix domain-containing protein [Acetatifactor sp.]